MRENKIVLLQGPPCSGKTFWANPTALDMEFDFPPLIIRTKDLKWQLNDKGKYDIETLDCIEPSEYAQIRVAIQNNRTVFVDATNCNPRRVKLFNDLAKQLDCELVIKPFYVKYDDAITRNKARRSNKSEYVPREAITAFYKQYYQDQFRYEMTDHRKITEYVEGLPDCIICDLDVTLALHMGRGPLDWDEIHTDVIDPRLRDILNHYMDAGTKVIFITGRIEAARTQTEEWLKDPKNKIYPWWDLYMRPGHCFDSGEEFKLKVYNEHIKNKYNVICVFEDSQKCVNMFREQGLLVCQTAITE